MKITREEVLRVAELAHLELSEAEVAKYQQQLDSILEYIAKLNAVDTSKIEPMAQVLAESKTANPAMRDDVVAPCEVAKDVLKQAPDAQGAYFRVPKVIER
ncbi:MAG: Asp-tRNA(Asn)/Glu-tRNA(Gln) amidotransferase subunit GatC [Candidatus Acidiferrales bacterium]